MATAPPDDSFAIGCTSLNRLEMLQLLALDESDELVGEFGVSPALPRFIMELIDNR